MSTMSQSDGGIEILWPGAQVPVSVLLDDPTPCRNPLWYEQPDAGLARDIPNGFTERFADVIARTGAHGKFSVVPCPGGTGRLDQGVPGVTDGDLHAFLRIVRERIAPTWDVGPEMITHNRAYDLETGGLLAEREDVWGDHQTVETLTPYISLALQILRNVGLEPNGVTSPWEFAIAVEDAYNSAAMTALREVCGVRVGWYFLHADGDSPAVPPRIARLQSAEGAALVSLVSASRVTEGHADFAWRTMFGEPALTDSLLTSDGRRGRLADLFPHSEPMIFHTHWQSLYSNGSGVGLDALEELFNRINRVWGDRVRWMSARQLAVYSSASAAAHYNHDGNGIRFDAPFECPDFTVRIPPAGAATAVLLDGKPLEQVESAVSALREGTWKPAADGPIVCIALRDGAELSWS